jgi:hypothetical protein
MEWDKDAWDLRSHILFRCRVSRVYHQKRERFYDILDSVTKAVALVGGAASIARIAKPEQLVIVGAIITLTSTLSLVIGYSKKSRSHSDLAKSFIDLECKVIAAGIFNHVQACIFESETIRLEMNESRSLGALVRICSNEIFVAEGKANQVRRISAWQRLWAHFYDFDLSPKPERKSKSA